MHMGIHLQNIRKPFRHSSEPPRTCSPSRELDLIQPGGKSNTARNTIQLRNLQTACGDEHVRNGLRAAIHSSSPRCAARSAVLRVALVDQFATQRVVCLPDLAVKPVHRLVELQKNATQALELRCHFRPKPEGGGRIRQSCPANKPVPGRLCPNETSAFSGLACKVGVAVTQE